MVIMAIMWIMHTPGAGRSIIESPAILTGGVRLGCVLIVSRSFVVVQHVA